MRQAGKQSVFVLRVKQGANPNFAFLMPDHPLQSYFQWLVDMDPEEKPPLVSRFSNSMVMGDWQIISGSENLICRAKRSVEVHANIQETVT